MAVISYLFRVFDLDFEQFYRVSGFPQMLSYDVKGFGKKSYLSAYFLSNLTCHLPVLFHLCNNLTYVR